MPINPQTPFAPYINGPGLSITINAGTTLVAGIGAVALPRTLITVNPNTTTFVYLDFAAGGIATNHTGFPVFNFYPIATVVADFNSIRILTDNRVDLFAQSANPPESIQSISNSQTIGFAGGVNTTIQATGGATGITLTLPNPSGLSGKQITIVRMDADVGDVMISGTTNLGSQYDLLNQNQYVVFKSVNTKWLLVGNGTSG